jgi:hypothetical protein
VDGRVFSGVLASFLKPTWNHLKEIPNRRSTITGMFHPDPTHVALRPPWLVCLPESSDWQPELSHFGRLLRTGLKKVALHNVVKDTRSSRDAPANDDNSDNMGRLVETPFFKLRSFRMNGGHLADG